jgi:hypothetical protein
MPKISAESFKWEKFLGELADAVQDKQPTLFLAEHVNSLTTTYPDLFYALPQLRPSEPLVSDACLYGPFGVYIWCDQTQQPRVADCGS